MSTFTNSNHQLTSLLKKFTGNAGIQKATWTMMKFLLLANFDKLKILAITYGDKGEPT